MPPCASNAARPRLSRKLEVASVVSVVREQIFGQQPAVSSQQSAQRSENAPAGGGFLPPPAAL